MRFVGITGGVGAGKTEILNFLAKKMLTKKFIFFEQIKYIIFIIFCLYKILNLFFYTFSTIKIL